MRRLILEPLAATAITLGAIVASAHEAYAGDIMVMGAFARASATPAATTGVVYGVIANHGAAADRLLSASTPAAMMAEVHESKEQNGSVSMAPVGALDIPAGATVALKPGGLHLMLMHLAKPLKMGETLHVDFVFEKAASVGVDVPVKGVAATAP